MKNLPSNFYEFYKDKKTKNLLHLREDINEDEKEWLKDEERWRIILKASVDSVETFKATLNEFEIFFQSDAQNFFAQSLIKEIHQEALEKKKKSIESNIRKCLNFLVFLSVIASFIIFFIGISEKNWTATTIGGIFFIIIGFSSMIYWICKEIVNDDLQNLFRFPNQMRNIKVCFLLLWALVSIVLLIIGLSIENWVTTIRGGCFLILIGCLVSINWVYEQVLQIETQSQKIQLFTIKFCCLFGFWKIVSLIILIIGCSVRNWVTTKIGVISLSCSLFYTIVYLIFILILDEKRKQKYSKKENKEETKSY